MTETAQRQTRPARWAAVAAVILVITFAAQGLFVKTFRELKDGDSLFAQTESLTVLANAQRQALALVNTLDRTDTDADVDEFELRLGLLLQQTRVMEVNAAAKGHASELLHEVAHSLEVLAASRSALDGMPTEMWPTILIPAGHAARGIERMIKELYDREERRIFQSVKADSKAKHRTLVTLASLSGVVILLGGYLLHTQRRRARSSIETAYHDLLREVEQKERAQLAIEQSRRRLAEAERAARVGSFEYDVSTAALAWSDEHYRLFDIDPDTVPTFDLVLDHLHPDDVAGLRSAVTAAVTDATPIDQVFRIRTAAGERRSLRVRARATRAEAPNGDEGPIERLNGTVSDVTEQVRAERERQHAERRFTVGFEQSAIGTVIADLDGKPTMVNEAMCRFLGRDRDELVGRTWVAMAHPDAIPLGAAVMRRVAMGEDHFADERRYIRPDGSVVWALTNVDLVRGPDGEPDYYFSQFQDITNRKAMEEELRHQALHDGLTGLPNRALLSDRLELALARARRRSHNVGLIFLDLDHFKLINDALGHAAGDEVVIAVGQRVVHAVRPEDTVSRFGGDEFVVLCENVTPAALEAAAGRIAERLTQPFSVDGREVHIQASLGVVLGGVGATAEGLLRDADVAMYKAKETGRGRIQLFDEDLRNEASHRFDMEADLRRALAARELCVFYQPIVSLDTGDVLGAEALVRWRHPERGLIPPMEFIPIAEESGLIAPLGEFVLEEALRQVAEWREELGLPRFFVTVNVSARQLALGNLFDVVEAALARTGASPDALHLEITESDVMDDLGRSVDLLTRLRVLGVHVAVDDFGTGYSSLSYLKTLPVDSLKIDRSFVEPLTVGPDESPIAQAIVSLAQALDLNLVAEGVETPEQAEILGGMGCQMGQGYHWSKPLPSDELAVLLASWPGANGDAKGDIVRLPVAVA